MRGSSAQRSLDKALKAFGHSDSNFDRKVSKSLEALDKTHKRLRSQFEERATLRKQGVTSRQPDLRTRGTRAGAKRSGKSDKENAADTELVRETAAILLEFERRQAELQKNLAGLDAAMADVQDRVDALFRDWYDAVVAAAVNALWEDASFDKALLLLSAASTGVGLAPAGATASAVVGAALLFRETRDKLSKIKVTKAAARRNARVERAHVLIAHAEALGTAWSKIIEMNKAARKTAR